MADNIFIMDGLAEEEDNDIDNVFDLPRGNYRHAPSDTLRHPGMGAADDGGETAEEKAAAKLAAQQARAAAKAAQQALNQQHQQARAAAAQAKQQTQAINHLNNSIRKSQAIAPADTTPISLPFSIPPIVWIGGAALAFWYFSKHGN